MKYNIKYLFFFIIIVLCLLLLSSSNATTKNGWFGEELKIENQYYSVSIIEGYNAYDDKYMASLETDYYYTYENSNRIEIWFGRTTPDEIGNDELGSYMFDNPFINIIKNETINGINIYYMEKTHPKFSTEYFIYAVSEKDGQLYTMLTNKQNSYQPFNDKDIEEYADLFREITDTIERK